MKAKYRGSLVENTYEKMLEKERAKGNKAAIEFDGSDPLSLSHAQMRILRSKNRGLFQNNRRKCYFCQNRFEDESMSDWEMSDSRVVDCCIACFEGRLSEGD